MGYALHDLDAGTAWAFEDIQEARAAADQLKLRHWSIMHGGRIIDQKHMNGAFIDVRERYASVLEALDAMGKDQALNLINLWAETSDMKGDLIEELEAETPLVWMRATDLGEEDA